MADDNNIDKMFKDMKKKKNKAKKNKSKEKSDQIKEKNNNTNKSNSDKNKNSNNGNTSDSVTISKKNKTKYSKYRENLYLDKEIQKKLNEVSEQTGYSKSEIARKAFKYFFDKLEIQ